MIRKVMDWGRAHPFGVDVLIAVLCLLTAPIIIGDDPQTRFGWKAALAAVVGVVPLLVRRRLPMLAALLVFPGLLTGLVGGWTTQTLTLAVVAVSVASRLSLIRAIVASLLIWTPIGVLVAINPPQIEVRHRANAFIFNLLLSLTLFFIGRTLYHRRAYVAGLEERTRVAEANLATRAERAVADERRRIARELHDVVAHHVSVMGVLATGAQRSLETDPASAADALHTISETGRTTLRELKRLLNVLRTDDESAEMLPQPGIAQVDSLISQVSEAGLTIDLQVEGEPFPVEEAVGLTVYRIVQEAVTNVLKHAGRARAWVRLGYRPGQLSVEIFDDGHGPLPGPQAVGHGLVGMRERVALYGGELRTGPRPGGGFRVYAQIPVEAVLS